MLYIAAQFAEDPLEAFLSPRVLHERHAQEVLHARKRDLVVIGGVHHIQHEPYSLLVQPLLHGLAHGHEVLELGFTALFPEQS